MDSTGVRKPDPTRSASLAVQFSAPVETIVFRPVTFPLLRVISLSFLLGLLSLASSDFARPNTPQVSRAGKTIRVQVMDSRTGFDVSAVALSVRDTRSGQVFFSHDTSELSKVQGARAAGGRKELTLEAGSYVVEVASRGYRDSSAVLAVSPTSPSQIDFYLDPLVPPAETAATRLRGLHRPDATLLAGFVSDEESGLPLAGVRISAGGTAISAGTNARGFFELLVPLPKIHAGLATADVAFARDGFVNEVRRFVELQPGSDWIYRIRMSRGAGTHSFDERKSRSRGTSVAATAEEDAAKLSAKACEAAPVQAAPPGGPLSPPPATNVPGTIRVGRNCSCTTCTTVEVYSLETYVKHVLPAEWFSCWGNSAVLPGGMNSLQAGAVAIRSYGAHHQQHPLDPNYGYDICDNTCCQVFGSATSTNADQATDDTAGRVLVDAAGDIARTEYSSENNNSGCGDCSTGVCIFDPVCCGSAVNGHGRGMCQYGSARWATSSRITTASPCSLGQIHSYGSKNWQEILQLYYPALFVSQGSTLQIGDRVRAMQATEVRSDAGANCPTCQLICSAAGGSTGTILVGPATAENSTWWQITWDNGTSACSDGTSGWSAENFLLKIGANISVSADAATLYFTATAGQTAIAPRGVMLREAGRRAEAWTAATSTPWLTLTTASGTTSGLLRAAVNIAGLAAGMHTGTITVSSPTSAFAAFSVTVHLALSDGLVGNVDRSVPATLSRVDGYDFLRLAHAYGADPTKPNWDPSVNLVDTDTNGNGVIEPHEMVIDGADFLEMAKNMGRTG